MSNYEWMNKCMPSVLISGGWLDGPHSEGWKKRGSTVYRGDLISGSLIQRCASFVCVCVWAGCINS